MATSLYDLSVANYFQSLTAVSGFLEKGLTHFKANNLNLDELVEMQLFADMLPFRFQVVSIAHHSAGTIDAMRSGVFRPPTMAERYDYAGLQKLIADSRAKLQALSPADVNAFEGKEVVFEMGPMKAPFTAEAFVLSFSLPNFYFHAATAYDILRIRGVPLGKRDFMGPLRINAPPRA
jgi:hypothetical protein